MNQETLDALKKKLVPRYQDPRTGAIYDNLGIVFNLFIDDFKILLKERVSRGLPSSTLVCLPEDVFAKLNPYTEH